MTVKTIDIPPTWSEILPALLLLLKSKNAEARLTAEVELERMAGIADRHMAHIINGGN